MSFSHDKAREEALAHVSALVEGADSIKGDLRAHAEAHFTAEELAILRGGKPFTDAMTAKLIDAVFEFAYKFFEAHQNWVKLPSTQELPYTFIFRYALCAYLHALHWIAAGGGQDRKQDKFGNDMVDVAMATYATCFDGFLSKDKLAMEIYDNAKFLLENGFLREDSNRRRVPRCQIAQRSAIDYGTNR